MVLSGNRILGIRVLAVIEEFSMVVLAEDGMALINNAEVGKACPLLLPAKRPQNS